MTDDKHGDWCEQTIRPTEHADTDSTFLHNDRCRDSRPAVPTALDVEDIEAALTEFIYIRGSDFDAREFPAMAKLRDWSPFARAQDAALSESSDD